MDKKFKLDGALMQWSQFWCKGPKLDIFYYFFFFDENVYSYRMYFILVQPVGHVNLTWYQNFINNNLLKFKKKK